MSGIKRIAFIIVVNNEQYYEECCYYIKRLMVPEYIEVDIIAVREADSMCVAYNMALKSSNARYKVYLHQDVFIRNNNFISDLLEIFEKDESVGMVGMVGGDHMPKTGVAYRAWNKGCVDCREPDMAYYLVCEPKTTSDAYVEAVDGLLIATQYDILWREDLFHHFDFYDVSQSFEMRKRGYKILVPYQKVPWVIHDSSFAKMMHYDEGRKACLKEYPEYFYSDNGFQFLYDAEWDILSAALVEQIQNFMERGDWETVSAIIEQYRQGKRKDSTLERLGVMSDIVKKEKKAGIFRHFFSELYKYSQIYDKYTYIKFLFFRMELNLPEGEYGDLQKAIENGDISCEAAVVFVLSSVSDKANVFKKLLEIYRKAGKRAQEEYIRKLYILVKNKPVPVAHTKCCKLSDDKDMIT